MKQTSHRASNLSRLMGYAGNHRYLTYTSWLLAALSALLALVPFWYIWRILQGVLTASPASHSDLISYSWHAVGFAVLSMLIYTLALLCSHLAAFRVATNLRKCILQHIATLPIGAVTAFGSGKLRKIINESGEATETYLAHQLPDRAAALATPCGLLVLLLVFDWRLGILSLIPVALGFLIMMSMTGQKMRERMTEYRNALADMENEAVEYIRGIPVVKTFGQTAFSFQKFKSSIDRYQTWVIAYTKSLRIPMMLYTAAINGVFVFLIAGGLWFTRDGVTLSFLLNLLFYIIITPVIALTLTKIMFQSENAMIVADSLCRIDSILQLKPLPEASVAIATPAANRVLSLEHVYFRYDNTAHAIHVTHATNATNAMNATDRDAVSDVSLSIAPGQTIALVGSSGSGKTTLTSLIARFFDPTSGHIRWGGVDIRDISHEEWMNTVSFVLQDSHLIKASILDNVRLGKPEASEQQVREALQAAQCMDIIEKLPQGIHTRIGTRGVYLSGGEQQRIAIARAILKDTPIVLLDEATAFADPDNETKVQAAFTKLSQGKTVILIAHRLSTIRNADCIFVMQEGRIVEAGTGTALLEQKGIFAHMWEQSETAAQWKTQQESQRKSQEKPAAC